MIHWKEKIERLKKERDAVILAHYYVSDEVQEVADYVGDSFYLSQIAKEALESTILFCGVKFMGESAKLLSPQKTVLMPDANADCPMAHMVTKEQIQKVRESYEDLAVVCYINSTAEIKMYADVCVTSSNAFKIVSKLPNKYIYFIPDENLGRYIASFLPEKEFIFHDGYCPIHKKITEGDVIEAKRLHPDAKVLVHPECTPSVTALADYVGSTSGIISYASQHEDKQFIVCTETGVFYEMKKQNPDKQFFTVRNDQFCSDMKLITLQKVAETLEQLSSQVELPDEMYQKANEPLLCMLELAK